MLDLHTTALALIEAGEINSRQAFDAAANPEAVIALAKAYISLCEKLEGAKADLKEADRHAVKLQALVEPHINWKNMP
jgi:hypothetical protein